MKKCIRCNQEMVENLVVMNGGNGYQTVVSVPGIILTELGNIRAAVCTKCGYLETYIDDLENFNKKVDKYCKKV